MNKLSTKIDKNWIRKIRETDRAFFTDEDWLTLAWFSSELPYAAVRLKLPVFNITSDNPGVLNTQHHRARPAGLVMLSYDPTEYLGHYIHPMKNQRIAYGEIHEYDHIGWSKKATFGDMPNYSKIATRFFYIAEEAIGQWTFYGIKTREDRMSMYLIENWK